MKKVTEWLNDKKIAIAAIIVFAVSLIPILYLAQYARPSGDDYGYSIYTHAAWLDTHSLIEVFKAAIYTVETMYQGWNGDWFTVFLFSLMPEVFAPYTFWIVPYIMIGAVVIGTTLFLYYILVKVIGMDWEYAIILDMLILLVTYQFIPSTAIGMYWYVGATHYMLPHAVALLALMFGFRFYQTERIANIVYATLCMFMVGGSSYFSSLLVFMIYALMMLILFRKNKKIFYLLIPFFVGAVGFVIQCISPGNAARAGEDFGFHISDVLATIGQSLWNGIILPFTLLKEKTFIYIIFLLCAVFGWAGLLKCKKAFHFPLPFVFVFFMYGFYSAMYAPAIYSAVDVSLGPDTMVYLTFLLTSLFSIIYVEGWLIEELRKKYAGKTIGRILLHPSEYRGKIMFPIIFIAVCLTLLNKNWLGNCVDKRAYDYIVSGQAEDFREQIASQMEILLDDSIREAYLVPTNDNQGPLMHMPVIADENAFTNWAVREFYRKDKVVTVEVEEGD